MSAPTMDPAARRADRDQRPALSGWRRLLVAAGVVSVLAFLLIGAVLGDLEAVVYAVGFALGIGLLRLRAGRVGEVLLLLLNLNVLAWMALGAASNIREGQGLFAVAIPGVLVALALAGALAAGGSLLTRRHPPERAPLWVVLLAAGTLVLLLAAGTLTASEGAEAAAGELAVDTSNLRFTPDALETTAGAVTVRVTNGDLFWHTFTIDELGVDVPVAVGAERRASFEAPAGTYDYYCRIPGHEALMQGTLTVTEAG